MRGAVRAGRDVSLEEVWLSADAAAFVRNTWPLYVHDLSAFDTDFYSQDALGRWQPDIVGDWLAPHTPRALLREARSAHDPVQPFQRAYAIAADGRRVGFVCVGLAPFRYIPADVDAAICETFVVHSQRGTGVAERAVGLVLRRHPGRWALAAIHDNARAIAFWARALPALGVRDLERSGGAGREDVVFRFTAAR